MYALSPRNAHSRAPVYYGLNYIEGNMLRCPKSSGNHTVMCTVLHHHHHLLSPPLTPSLFVLF